jgi:hypothetical protein
MMHPKHELLLKKNAKRIQVGADDKHRAFYFALDKASGEEILHIDRKIKKPTKFNTVNKLNRTLEPFQDDEYSLNSKSKLCSGMVSRGDDGRLLFEVQIKRGVGANLLARSLKKYKRYIGIAAILKDGLALDVDAVDDMDLDAGTTVDPVVSEAERAEDDLDLAAEIAAELAEANLTDNLFANTEESLQSVSYFLLQQQQMFRRGDAQLDPVLKPEELSFTLNGEAVTLDAKMVQQLGLDSIFDVSPEGLRLKDRFLDDEVISPDERGEIAASLLTALQDTPGLKLTLANPDASGASMELFARDGDSFGQLVDHRQVASAKNLQFDRRLDIVPGSEPARSFLDVVQEMNHADEGSFAELNEMLADAFTLDKLDGRVSDGMTFQQYKMQFVDLEVGGVLESGLQWHDNTGALGAEEWAFLQMKVKDLPDRTQNNYYVQMSWDGMSGKPIERKLDINCSGTVMNQLVADKKTSELVTHILGGLADEGWSSGLVGPGASSAELVAAYRARGITVKMGYWDARGKLTWDPEKGQRAALINTMDGRDMLEPLVNNIPEGALKTLLAGEDGQTRNLDGSDCDLTSPDGLEAAKVSATDGIAKTIMTTAITSWTENSTEAMGELLSGIPDTQKVFLRQSNGVVNAVRIVDTDVREAMDLLGAIPGLTVEVEELERLMSQPGTSQRYVRQAASRIEQALRRLGMDEDQLALVQGAIDDIKGCNIKEIGQDEIITDGNDTGAFGKCAPTSYFCAAICGVSRAARNGFDLLLDGGMELRAAAGKLEELFSTGAMTDERRLAIDEQIGTVEDLISDLEAQRDEAREDLFNSPEWIADTEAHMAETNQLFEEQQALIDAFHETEEKLAARDQKTAAITSIKDSLALFDRLKADSSSAVIPALGDGQTYTWSQLKKMQHPDYPGKTFHDVKLLLRKNLPDEEKALAVLNADLAGQPEDRDARYAAMNEQYQDIESAMLDSQQDYKAQQQVRYQETMQDLEDEVEARKTGLKRVKKFKESIADRMVVGIDPEDGEPCLDMTFPVPESALDASAGDYSGGWLIKKLNGLAALPENAGRSITQIATEDLGVRYDSEKKAWLMDVKVKGSDIQEYLEQTNREDKYRGGKKHMMDFFKDPSSMNNIQLMKSLGPGLIAVGCDKMLKTMGKDSGLLYGPSAEVVATMVYNEQKVSEYDDISREIPDPSTEPEAYKAEFTRRRKSILDKLSRTQDDGGAMSVSMGYSNANGHVNYIVDWGTPSLGGVEISADDVARCRMNLAENTATSSAWNNDRVQDFPINTAAMGRGIDGILAKLREAGKADSDPDIKRLLELKATAQAATDQLDQIARENGGESAEKMAHLHQSGRNTYFQEIEEGVATRVETLTQRLTDEGQDAEAIKAEVDKQKPALEKEARTAAWANLSRAEKRAINNWEDLSKDSDYTAALDLIRQAAGEMSDFLKAGMTLKKTDGLKEENCLIMPSNTERDNRVSDNEEDRGSVGGGQIGSQKYGSANATDAVYCVPLNCLASSINGTITDDPDDPENKKCSATGYNYSPDNGADVPDQFVILTSMSTMLNKSARGF